MGRAGVRWTSLIGSGKFCPLAIRPCLDIREVLAVPFPRASKALTRFTVLDLTRVRAGPTSVRQLADWGARVVKIEAPPSGDEPMGGPREAGDFQNLHRNKRSMTLDLKTPAGLAAFKRMVKKADVVVENFRPSVKKRLGIDYAALRKINPRLVYASISGFGQDGPYAGRPGFDQIAQGMGGLMSITGPPGQGPFRVGIPVADLSAGLFAAMGILIALLEREKSGKGQAVETSLLQAQIFMLDFQAARYLVDGEVARQAGNNHPTTIPTGAFKTRDGYINIATTGGKMWERFCDALGDATLAQNPDYRTAEARSKNRDALDADDRAAVASRRPAPNGSSASTRPACRAGRSTRSTRCSPIRRSSTSAWRKKCRQGQRAAACRPAGIVVAHAITAGCPAAETWRTHRRLAERIRLFRARDRRPAQSQSGMIELGMTRKDRMMTQTDKLLARKEAGVGIVTFNNPERLNAVSLEMWEATKRALDTFAADNEVRVVVLTGAGDKAFVSGADISKFGSERSTLEGVRAYDATTAATFASIYGFPKPTIAMIRGYCIGGGLGLASCCDLRICPTIRGLRCRRQSSVWATVIAD